MTAARPISPVTGAALHRVGPHVLAAGDERWPVLDDIAFLRADRRALADAALALIDAGDPQRACALLLTDQDPFAPDPPPTVDDNLRLIADEAGLSFRDAMTRLRLGRVADYFAHRWSDPTFLSGLVLATAFERGPVLELCCGAGHFLPELARLGLRPIGADLVFAKLWLCRHFVCPDATLLCFDAQRAWPVSPDDVAGVFCHDAFYFLPDKAAVAAQARGRVVAAQPRGRVVAAQPRERIVAIGHAHNALAANHSAGLPLTPDAYVALFGGDAAVFDDRALTASFVSREAPDAVSPALLANADAISFLSPAGARLHPERLDRAPGAALRLNPLYRPEPGSARARIAWPSPRYEAEYAPLATYPACWDGAAPDEAAVRRRVYLELPPRW